MKHLLRTFLKSPGFFTVVIVTLALGIGANTAIFSVVRGVLLRPLAFAEPDRLVAIFGRTASFTGRGQMSALEYLDVRAQSQKLAGIAGFAAGDANLSGDGAGGGAGGKAERVTAGFVTPSFFPVLGVQPTIGRAFRPDEDVAGQDHVVILSHALFARHFASDPAVIGRDVLVDNERYRVVGVLPAGFTFESRHDLYVPLAFSAEQKAEPARDWHFMRVVGRLAPGVTVADENQELDVIGARLRADHPGVYGSDAHWHPATEPLLHTVVADVRPSLWLLAAAAAVVLLIVCGNVASLLLARASTRQRELSVRAALGASRRRLLGQLFGESLVLAAVGGALGILVALWGTDLLVSLAPEGLPRTSEIRVDAQVLVFSVVLVAVAAAIFGVFPAWSASRVDLHEALRSSGRAASAGTRPRRVRRALVVAETALALVLVTAAALVLRSFERVSHVDPGFRSDGVLSLRVTLPSAKEAGRWFAEATDRLAALPGVTHAGATSHVPLTDGPSDRLIDLEDAPTPPGKQRPSAQYRVVTPGTLETLRVPIITGRILTREDRVAAVVTQAFARRFWPDRDAVGHRFRLSSPRGPWVTIVGVVGDVRDTRLDEPAEPEMFLPLAGLAASEADASMGFVVRGNLPMAELARATRDELARIDPGQATYDVLPMSDRLAGAVEQRRFVLGLFELFAGLALGLAALGLYGLLAHAVSERRREIGVRVALGASSGDVLGLVAREGASLLGIGVALGLVGGLAAARLLEHLLYEVSPSDPVALVAAIGLLAVAAALATWLPARRALAVHPMEVLRDD